MTRDSFNDAVLLLRVAQDGDSFEISAHDVVESPGGTPLELSRNDELAHRVANAEIRELQKNAVRRVCSKRRERSTVDLAMAK
jgi:hypothetical protein